MCVCCTHLFSFFTLGFVLVNDLSLVSRCFLFWKCVRFCFRFCCRLFLFVVCTCILCLLLCHTRCSFIDVLSCTPTGVSEINHLTCQNKNKQKNRKQTRKSIGQTPDTTRLLCTYLITITTYLLQSNTFSVPASVRDILPSAQRLEQC